MAVLLLHDSPGVPLNPRRRHAAGGLRRAPKSGRRKLLEVQDDVGSAASHTLHCGAIYAPPVHDSYTFSTNLVDFGRFWMIFWCEVENRNVGVRSRIEMLV